MNWVRIWVLLLTISCGACAAPAREVPALGAGEPHKTIYLVSHGWHAGIVLRRVEPKVFMEMRGGHNDGFIVSQPGYERALGAFVSGPVMRIPPDAGSL